jgi:hypothetical protein
MRDLITMQLECDEIEYKSLIAAAAAGDGSLPREDSERLLTLADRLGVPFRSRVGKYDVALAKSRSVEADLSKSARA